MTLTDDLDVKTKLENPTREVLDSERAKIDSASIALDDSLPANDSDWVRAPKPGETLCGLKRATIYQLCASKKIRWVALKATPSAKRGVRLIFKPSLHAFLAELEREQRDGASSELGGASHVK